MRGRSHSKFKTQRSGYQGRGIPFTPVENGFKYFKLSFIENPWLELEAKQLAVPATDEEIQLEHEDVYFEKIPDDNGTIQQSHDKVSDKAEQKS